MAFIDERLLECVSDGTAGGPTFVTRKVSLRSGHIRRNAMRARPLYRYIVQYKNRVAAQHAAIIAAFNACYAGVESFRWKDWEDYQVDDQILTVGTGSAQSVQLFKAYTFGGVTTERPIRKPVAGTVVLTHNNLSLSAVVDYDTGIVTFTTTASHVVRFTCEFDVPVMFEQDELPFSGDNIGGARVLTGDVPLLEDISQ